MIHRTHFKIKYLRDPSGQLIEPVDYLKIEQQILNVGQHAASGSIRCPGKNFIKYLNIRSGLFRLVHVPYFTGAFVADHAGPDGCPGVADFGEEFTVRWLRNPPEDFITDTG
jgi:hypothetical protein